jgi:putative membrane protein
VVLRATTARAAPPHVVGSEYASTVAADDLFEIAAATVAIHKTHNADVRDLARALIPTHQQSLARLKAAAASARPPIAVKPAINPDQQAKLEALQSLAGPAFDHTFLQQQIDAHEAALKLIAGFAEDGDVPSLKQHAQSIEPAVHEHSIRAQDLRSTIK